VDYFGLVSGRDTDKFAATKLTPVKSDLVDAPFVKEFPLVLECKLVELFELGLGLLRFDGQEIGKSCKMKSIKDNPVKIRRKFDQNFKREALQNWFNSGKSAEVIAGELGLNSNLLYAWKKRFAPDGTGQRAPAAAKPGSVADLQAQLDAAHRENRHLREQRDILKKTLGILSEPPASVMNGSTR
jgi:transposase-like protein